jgi:hypothetical protein
MGRHHWSTRLTVEDCPILLDVRAFHRSGIFASLSGSSWSVSFTDPRGTMLGNIECTVAESGPTGLAIRFRDQETRLNSQFALVEWHQVPVTTTRPYLGGKRFWFLCPMIRNGRQCGKRVARVYLPSGQRIFGCRYCHNLTYQSVREHDNRKYQLARDPAALDIALRSRTPRKALFAVKASMLRLEWERKGRLSRFVP